MELNVIEQHQQLYINAFRELIDNNTMALINDDIMPLLMEPPLETMDMVKQRFFSIAKNYNCVLNTEQLNKYLHLYRQFLQTNINTLKKQRNETLIHAVKSFDYTKPTQIVRDLKKELLKLDKQMKKKMKEWLVSANQEYLLDHLDQLITDDTVISSFSKDITKYLQTTYLKQFLETFDIKVLIKDTTLLNSLKEQVERFIFTTKNSHLFDS